MAQLPTLGDPKAMAAAYKARQAAKAGTGEAPPKESYGSLVGQMVDAAATMKPGSFAEQMARLYAGKRGQKIPTAEEAELADLKLKNELAEQRKLQAKNAILDVQVGIAQLDPKFLKANGIDPDTMLDTDPDGFMLLGNKLGVALSREVLTLAGVPVTSTENAQLAAQAKGEKKASEALGQKASDARAVTEIDKAEQSATDSGTPLGALVERAGGGISGSDYDEAEPARKLRQSFNTAMEQADTPGLKELVAHGFLAKYGKDIADQFEEAATTDEAGNAVVGGGVGGNVFVTAGAKYELGNLLIEASKFIPGSENDQAPGGSALRAIGLGDRYAGINVQPDAVAK